MTASKARRQRAIEEILRTARPASQEELAERLASLGYKVGQATVSRDLDELGAVKVRSGGITHYSMPDRIGDTGRGAARLEGIVREWVRTVEAAGNLVVVRTPPGSAHLVGVALDSAELPEIAGTICGDDTVFAAAASPVAAARLAERLRSFL